MTQGVFVGHWDLVIGHFLKDDLDAPANPRRLARGADAVH
jgi:hypothetical protein